MPKHSKQQHQWMSGAPSPDDSRDGIDSKPSRGALSAIIAIVACVALAVLVLHALPYDVGKDIADFVTGNETTIATGNDANVTNGQDTSDASANKWDSANGTSDSTQSGKDSGTNGAAENASDGDANNGSTAQSPSKSGQVVKGNGWSVTLPQRWVGKTVISYSDSGNRAIVRTKGSGSGSTDENGNINRSDNPTPYLLLIERVSGSEPDTYGDVGSQLAYYVTSSDGTWHLEVWTINAVWLVRQDDRTPYESTSGQVWDTMCDLLTGGKVDSADAARALGDDDATIGTGEIDYLTATLKPETQTD